MIGYATLGTKDLPRACSFYDTLLAQVGGKQLMGMERIKFYGTEAGGAMLAICTPANEDEQSSGNGQMVAIPGGSPEGAKALYDKAIELGATDEGEPGQRMPIFYGGYVRDLDGNKLCFYHMSPAN
ncbi:MAG: VOC family protein [Lysobacterales bacterium]